MKDLINHPSSASVFYLGIFTIMAAMAACSAQYSFEVFF